MALKKILVAYDGSECGKKALAQAGDIAGLDQSIEIGRASCRERV